MAYPRSWLMKIVATRKLQITKSAHIFLSDFSNWEPALSGKKALKSTVQTRKNSHFFPANFFAFFGSEKFALPETLKASYFNDFRLFKACFSERVRLSCRKISKKSPNFRHGLYCWKGGTFRRIILLQMSHFRMITKSIFRCCMSYKGTL